jgi:hypothetical protein
MVKIPDTYNSTQWVDSTFEVMLDIESLGVKPGSVILNIGAVEFDPWTGEFGKELYVVIDVADSQSYGMTIDAETIKWWMNQSADARLSSFGGGKTYSLRAALNLLFNFTIGKKIWCHGPSFDASLLEYAYRKVGLLIPWKFSDVRCTRTIYDLAGVSPDRSKGTHHNALDDAKAQAVAVVAGYQRLSFKTAA